MARRSKVGIPCCSAFFLQLLKDGTYALRSVAVGLWVFVGGDAKAGSSNAPLVVAAPNPLLEQRAAFNLSAPTPPRRR